MFDIHFIVHGTTSCNHYNLTNTDFLKSLIDLENKQKLVLLNSRYISGDMIVYTAYDQNTK